MQSASKDSYWKFIDSFEGGNAAYYRCQIREAGYDLWESATDERTRKYLAHIQLGLPCYDSCSTAELEKFVKARKIHNNPGKCSRGWMVKRLMAADESREFFRFMDLPAELRNSVYELVMDGYAKPLTTPAQPPFALVSRQVRKEALSIFYSCCSFQIDLQAKSNNRFTFSPESLAFLNSLQPTDLSRFAHLQIQVLTPRQPSLHDGYTNFVISIEKSSEEKYAVKVHACGNHTQFSSAWSSTIGWCDMLEARLKTMMVSRKLDTGEKQLEVIHIYDIRRQIEASMVSPNASLF